MSESINTTLEVWKTIEEFPDYSVSNRGRVRRDTRCNRSPYGGPIKPWVTNKWYLIVALCIGGIVRKLSVHRLVAKAFLETKSRNETVNHKNGVKTDNSIDNLEWSSYGENNKHAYDFLGKSQPCGESHYRSKITGEDVKAIRKRHVNGETFTDISKSYGMGPRAISYIAKRQTWKHIIP